MNPATAGMVPTAAAWAGVQMPQQTSQMAQAAGQGVMGYPVQQGAPRLGLTAPFPNPAAPGAALAPGGTASAQPAIPGVPSGATVPNAGSPISSSPQPVTGDNPFLKFSKSAAAATIAVPARPTLAGARIAPYAVPVRNGTGESAVSPKLKQVN